MSLDRLHSCHILDEVALALETGLRSFVVPEKVLLEMAIEWGGSRIDFEQVHRLVNEGQANQLDWLYLDERGVMIVARYCLSLVQTPEVMVNVSKYCSDTQGGQRVEEEYGILVEIHHDYHHVPASMLF
jgi:hypothetical protein